MPPSGSRNTRLGYLVGMGLSATAGVAVGFASSNGSAELVGPSEHRGIQVSTLGVITDASMYEQIGLSGYNLQLREITIDPDGQIAMHSHATRPGLVKVINGTWIEGRPDGERIYAASDDGGILEDSETTHWFWNRGDEPATAIVCDIVPSS